MNPRARVPAYGKPLLEARRAGAHPPRIAVLYGIDWSMPEGFEARLAVKPGEALGLDWTVCAGLPVIVFDRRAAKGGIGDEMWQMTAQIAQHSPDVEIEDYGDIGVLAQASRESIDGHGWCWPAWWSETIGETYAEQQKNWGKWAEAKLAAHARNHDTAHR